MLVRNIGKLFGLSLIFVAVIMLAGCSSSSSPVSPKTFAGKATYTDKLVGADITLRDSSGLVLYKTQGATGSEGLYVIYGVNLPDSFTIEVTGGTTPDGQPFTGYLKRVVHSYEPNESYEVNGLTTLVAVYLERNPLVSYDNAVLAVGRSLSILDADTFAQISSAIEVADAWFSGSKFWGNLTGNDYDAFVRSVVADIEAGKVVSFADETLTADLPPVLDTTSWNFTGSSAKAAKKAADNADIKVGPANIIGGVLDVAFEIMDMQDAEEDRETLNRIDSNIAAMQQQLTQISKQLESTNALIIDSNYQTVNSKLRNYELGCISPALTAYKGMVKAKKEKSATLYGEKRRAFERVLNKKTCGGEAIDSFDDVLNTYANVVAPHDDASRSAIQLFTNVINTRSNTDAKANYQAIEDTFYRFIYYQSAALRVHVQYELYKYALELDKELPKPDAATKQRRMQARKDELITGFLEGPSEYNGKRMIMQIQRFVPAVETFVVSHNSELYYTRWLACDTMNSYTENPSGGECKEYERPFLRSQIISDQLLGSISSEGKKYGLFMKAIQLKQQDINFTDKNFVIGLRSYDFFREPRYSASHYSPVDRREITGKHPYNNGDATWYVSTYRVTDYVPDTTPMDFDLSHEANDTATPLFFRKRLHFLNPVYSKSLSKSYHAFNLWTVPVRDVRLTRAGQLNQVGQVYFPIDISNCDNATCYNINLHTRPSALLDVTPSRLRLYRVGPESNVAIGYRYNNNRYIVLPHDNWNWIGLCGNNQSMWAFVEKDMLVDNANKIHWKMQIVDEANGLYTFSRINEKNETKYLVYGNGDGYDYWLYYGWDSCGASPKEFKVGFDGAWK